MLTGETQSIPDQIRTLVLESDVQLPPLPELALKLQECLADEESADAVRVAELIHADPAIAASILRVANSARYGGLRGITDLRQAVARLGLKLVGSMVTSLVVKGNFAAKSPQQRERLRELWDTSVLTALCAQQLAERGAQDRDQAFLSGLLHDIGRLLVLRALESLGDVVNELTPPVLEELMQVLHPELGHRTLSEWKLPDEICDVALRHEEPAVADGNPCLLLVQAAIPIARTLESHPAYDPELNPLDDLAVELLGLTDIEVATLVVDLEDRFESFRKML